tara:strand:- start:10544 stop:11593 length:1050 start_codon:yes stop_codon:yes gene_type:complete
MVANKNTDPVQQNRPKSIKRQNVRFGGAQIPVTHDLKKNVVEIKEAIDWAAENKVDYLVTPEGSLSGYYDKFMDQPHQLEELRAGEWEVTQYAGSKQLGLCLGTLFLDYEPTGQLKRDQIRFYNKSGQIEDVYNKIQLILNDVVVPGEFKEYNTTHPDKEWQGHPIINLPAGPATRVQVSALICNDMYGENPKGEGIARRALYMLSTCPNPVELIIHPTYGLRGTEVIENFQYDGTRDGKEVSAEFADHIRKTMEDWHESTLVMLSYQLNQTFFIVDACSDFSGQMSDFNTSSPSGVVSKGEWLVKAPRKGKQYFYHDFELPTIIDYSMTTNRDIIGLLEKNNPKPIEE